MLPLFPRALHSIRHLTEGRAAETTASATPPTPLIPPGAGRAPDLASSSVRGGKDFHGHQMVREEEKEGDRRGGGPGGRARGGAWRGGGSHGGPSSKVAHAGFV